ncbi:hypothetical protein AB0M20_38950 [Actinoplanes sp. NPDC051633]|uniref:hypothetical protein n=1 Tax=Actinoplanes sp. NPDC051633 TaxID=3155670 RepID=UPI00342F2F68
MQPDLQADTMALTACSPPLLDLGAEVTAGAARTPRPSTVPRWASSDAADDVTGSVRAALTDLGSSISATAQAILAAVADYEAADRRSAARARRFR